jgi:hypothetical protein
LLKHSFILPQNVAMFSMQVQMVPVEEELRHLEKDPIELLEEVPTPLMDSSILAMEAPHMFGNEIDDILF